MDVDSTGGAVTGAVLTAAIEKPAGKADEYSHHCDDCGAEVSAQLYANGCCPTCRNAALAPDREDDE